MDKHLSGFSNQCGDLWSQRTVRAKARNIFDVETYISVKWMMEVLELVLREAIWGRRPSQIVVTGGHKI